MSTEYAEGPQTQPAWLDQPDCWGLLAMASIYGIWRPAEYKFYVTAMHPDRISLGIRTGRENYVWGRIPHGLRIGQSELGQFSAWLMAKPSTNPTSPASASSSSMLLIPRHLRGCITWGVYQSCSL